MVFDPLHPGIWEGWQKVRSQVEEEPWAEVELTGEGTGPWVPVKPEQLIFQPTTVGVTTTPQTITLESQDRQEFTIEDISTAPVGDWSLSSPFQVAGGSCHEGESLAPGETCTIEVVMAPTVSGFLQGKLMITDTAPDSPQSVRLEGTATAAPASDQASSPGSGLATTPPWPTGASHTRLKHGCPKGKRKAIKKGRQICTKGSRHRRHPAHA